MVQTGFHKDVPCEVTVVAKIQSVVSLPALKPSASDVIHFLLFSIQSTEILLQILHCKKANRFKKILSITVKFAACSKTLVSTR